MSESEKYQPSPSEVRSAESHMDDRQKELSEVREDSVFEGKKRANKNKNKDESLDSYRGYTDEDLKKAKNGINKMIDIGRSPSVAELANYIDRSKMTTCKIIHDLGLEQTSYGVKLPENKFE